MTPSMERMRVDLIRIRYELAARKFARALETEALLRAKYNPMQPRVPAGNPGGGQWTSGGYQAGGGSGSGLQSPFGGGWEDGGGSEFYPESSEEFDAFEGGSEFEFGSDNEPVQQVAEFGAGATPEYSPDRPGFHGYVAGPNLVCPAEWKCTGEDAQDANRRYGRPGQDSSVPLRDGERGMVFDPRTGMPAGYVKTEISPDGLTITNKTLPFHVFHSGEIVRTMHQDESGAWYVTTRGIGNNVLWLPLPQGGRVPPEFFALINAWQGPKIFTFMDGQMRDYLARKKGVRKSAPLSPAQPCWGTRAPFRLGRELRRARDGQ